MRIPAADPGARFRAQAKEISDALSTVIAGSRYILGPQVEAWEDEFARYLGVHHCVGVASGTDAITLALIALGMAPGDEIICPALTAHGTAIGIQRAGARPVFADVEETTRCLDPRAVEALIGPRTTAIVAVHLHGLAAPVEALRAIADRHGLCLVEDAAQAHGARAGSRRLGSFGHAAAFSFYPTKNLGCLGDGGIVACPDHALAERVRRLRSYGWDANRVSDGPGFNSRLDEIQAAVLRVMLPTLDGHNEKRRSIAARYARALAPAPLGLPPADEGSVYHQYAILAEEREALRGWLADAGIGTDVHYPLGLHRMPAFPDADLPVTDSLARRLVSLPVQPEIAEPHVERISGRILEYRWRG